MPIFLLRTVKVCESKIDVFSHITKSPGVHPNYCAPELPVTILYYSYDFAMILLT